VEKVLSTTPDFAMNAEQKAAKRTRMGVSLKEPALIQDRSNKEAHVLGFSEKAELDERCFFSRSSQDAGVSFVAVRPGQTVMVAITVALEVSDDTVRHNKIRPTQGAPNVVQIMLSKLGECSDVGDECTM
jgi:hypothetical protein